MKNHPTSQIHLSQRKSVEKVPQSDQQCTTCNTRNATLLWVMERTRRKKRLTLNGSSVTCLYAGFKVYAKTSKVANANTIVRLAKKGSTGTVQSAVSL
ncbi:hypothetical protein EB796_022031 [Bugula neritina]|uniref:Uncharacterized protein n=1 Tax=Bugula neritina TaxID=10212 RepID=A0A7J7J2J3_BUGNE|nr:hypothetical protein EB796_022031 [Bugula neritina]